jgi:signal peptidase I
VWSGLIALSPLAEPGSVTFALPFALIALIGGIGMLRRRVWSAYGLALLYLAHLLLVPLLLARSGAAGRDLLTIIVATMFDAGLCVLFFRAGRLLSACGASRGLALPWIALAILTCVPFLFVQAFSVPTASMEDTLLVGDRVLVQRFPPVHPVRGGIVAFRYPPDRTQTFLKRIIGAGGDHIRITHQVVFRNGVAQSEPYVIHKLDYEDAFKDNFPSDPGDAATYAPGRGALLLDMLANHVVAGEVVVPAGQYFVMGDNRDNSLDSRFWGFVGEQDILGKPILIYGSVNQPTGEITGRRLAGIGEVRWDRLFRRL